MALCQFSYRDRNQRLFLADALKNEKFLRWLLDAIEVELVSHGSKWRCSSVLHEGISGDSRFKRSAGAQSQQCGAKQHLDHLRRLLILKFFRRT